MTLGPCYLNLFFSWALVWKLGIAGSRDGEAERNEVIARARWAIWFLGSALLQYQVFPSCISSNYSWIYFPYLLQGHPWASYFSLHFALSPRKWPPPLKVWRWLENFTLEVSLLAFSCIAYFSLSSTSHHFEGYFW